MSNRVQATGKTLRFAMSAAEAINAAAVQATKTLDEARNTQAMLVAMGLAAIDEVNKAREAHDAAVEDARKLD